MRRARGFSLIELIVVIGLTGTFLAGTTAVLHLLFRSERSVRDGVDQQHSVARLAEQLRRDAHSAKSAELPAEPAGSARVLLLQLNDVRSVSYSLAGQKIERLVREQGAIVQRETFSLRTNVRGTWRMASVGQHQLVELDITSPDKNWTIRAAIGRL